MFSAIHFASDPKEHASLHAQGYVALSDTGYWADAAMVRLEKRFVQVLQKLTQDVAALKFPDDYLRTRHQSILSARKAHTDRHEVEVQADTVLRVLSDTRVVTVVTGPPGTTKSTVAALACQSVRQVFPDTPIIVMTQEIPALNRLQTKINLGHVTAYDVVTALASDVLWPIEGCVVIDEAGLLGTDIMAGLLDKAAQSGARKIILIGDDKQLSANESGQPFRWLSTQTDINRVELVHSFRQRNPVLRDAVRHVYHDRMDAALAIIPHHFYAHDALVPALQYALAQCTPENTYVVVKGSDDVRSALQNAFPTFKIFTLYEAQGLAIDRVIFIIADTINRADLLVGCSRQRFDLAVLIDQEYYRDDADFIARIGDYPQSRMVVDIITPDALLEMTV